MNKKRRTVLYILLIIILICALYLIWNEIHSNKKEEEAFDDLKQIVTQEATDKTEEKDAVKTMKETKPERNIVETNISKFESKTEDTSKEIAELTEETEHVPERNITALTELNKDCIGWVYAVDTYINYPVMHTPEDPEKYLRIDFYEEDSHAGVPFMDYRCTVESDNILLYGHNMKTSSMFSQVDNYIKESYRDAHPTIEFETLDGCKRYTVFAAAIVGAADDWYQFTDAQTQEEYDEMISYIKSIALYPTNIIPQYGQQLITLSTCDYSKDDARFIVVAVSEE